MNALVNSMASGSRALVTTGPKQFKWDPQVKIPTNSPIMGQIHRNIKASGKLQFTIDIPAMASFIDSLQPRMGKAVLEIIMEYHFSNPETVQVMTKKDSPPYNGIYDPENKNTGFDLAAFPEPLIIILHEFHVLVLLNSQVKD